MAAAMRGGELTVPALSMSGCWLLANRQLVSSGISLPSGSHLNAEDSTAPPQTQGMREGWSCSAGSFRADTLDCPLVWLYNKATSAAFS